MLSTLSTVLWLPYFLISSIVSLINILFHFCMFSELIFSRKTYRENSGETDCSHDFTVSTLGQLIN